MAEKSGFFNALLVDNEYDRKYNADDYSNNLAVIISNGVLRSTNDDLKVTSSGMNVSVAAGRAWIDGHYYLNDATKSFTAPTAPTSGNRYDRIMLRLDKTQNGRKISLVYVQGTAAATPTKPAPTRTSDVYDLVLANLYLTTNATSVVVTDTRADTSVCGWIYSTSGDNSFYTSLDTSFNEWFAGVRNTLSSVTLFKRYSQTITLASASSSVTFSIPQYDSDTCFLEVYVNGIFDTGYTVANSVITFDGTLTSGTKVTVNCYKSIDGTGIQTVSEEITQLQNQVAALSGSAKFTYKCTGLNDNIALSEIAQAIHAGSYTVGSLSSSAEAFLSALGGNAYLSALPTAAQIQINIVGNLGATTPAAGAGTSTSRYRWFNLGQAGESLKKIVFDFANCHDIDITCTANTHNIIFYGTDLYVRNVSAYGHCSGAGCPIQMFAGSANTGNIEVENGRFSVITSGLAVLSENGTFKNCRAIIISSASNAFCFAPKSDSLIRVIGGTYYAYISANGMTPAIFYTYNTETNAVVMAENINAPTVARTGYSQQYLSVAGAGNTYINGVTSTMNSSGTGNTITGQIWKSKAR